MNAPYRVTVSANTTSLLRSLTTKTGLSPNILARFAMLISFEDAAPLAVDAAKPDLTINRASLFGEMEPFLMSAYALASKPPDGPGVAKDLANHIARGTAFLNVRVQNLADLVALVSQ